MITYCMGPCTWLSGKGKLQEQRTDQCLAGARGKWRVWLEKGCRGYSVAYFWGWWPDAYMNVLKLRTVSLKHWILLYVNFLNSKNTYLICISQSLFNDTLNLTFVHLLCLNFATPKNKDCKLTKYWEDGKYLAVLIRKMYPKVWKYNWIY